MTSSKRVHAKFFSKIHPDRMEPTHKRYRYSIKGNLDHTLFYILWTLEEISLDFVCAFILCKRTVHTAYMVSNLLFTFGLVWNQLEQNCPYQE